MTKDELKKGRVRASLDAFLQGKGWDQDVAHIEPGEGIPLIPL